MKFCRGVFYSLLLLIFFVATLPAFAADTDADGLTDDVEAQLGSSPVHKDLYIYISFMIWNGKNLKPRGNFVTLAKQVFAAAPVINPDGTSGITLHLEIGPPIRTNVLIYSWEDFDAIKNQYFPASKRSTHHYCLFAGALGDDTGASSISGYSRNGAAFKQGASDSIVALGHPAWFNKPTAALYKWTQLGTFIHEIGHNLGLMHGGGDHVSFKPNHLSLMSYAYQTDGIPITVPGDGEYYLYDYARFAGPNLNEANLNENVGMGGKVIFQGTFYGARWYYFPDYDFMAEIFDASSNVDWDFNGFIQNGVRLNLNSLFDDKVAMLRGGVNEWTRLYFKGGQIGKASTQAQSILPSKFLYPCKKAPNWNSKAITAAQKIQRITFAEAMAKRK